MTSKHKLFERAIHECRVIEFQHDRQTPPGGRERTRGLPIDFRSFSDQQGDRYHILFQPKEDGSGGGDTTGIRPEWLHQVVLLEESFDPVTDIPERPALPWGIPRDWPARD